MIYVIAIVIIIAAWYAGGTLIERSIDRARARIDAEEAMRRGDAKSARALLAMRRSLLTREQRSAVELWLHEHEAKS